MKKILLIGTGGTIASAEGEEGLSPALDISALIGYIPQALEICDIHTLQIMSIDSTNMQPEHWLKITHTIRERYGEYDGFVITHGTDTLAYTAAFLSYMVQNSRKPIVVTGSQKPIGEIDTDTKKNLSDSIRFACEEAGGVFVVFNGNVINGCRAVKLRTRSWNAFESINYPYVAVISEKNITFNSNKTSYNNTNEVKFYTSASSDVALIKLIPGIKPEMFDFIIGRYKGVVMESFGSGGVPFIGEGNILDKIENLIAAGIVVVITTQVLFEGEFLNLYEVGQKILKKRILPAYDMTTEAAVTKLMWALGQSSEFEQIKKMFLTPVNGDMTIYINPIE